MRLTFQIVLPFILLASQQRWIFLSRLTVLCLTWNSTLLWPLQIHFLLLFSVSLLDSYCVGLGMLPLPRCDSDSFPVLTTSNIRLTFKDFTGYTLFTHHTCLGENAVPGSSLPWEGHSNCRGASSWCLQCHSSPQLMSITFFFESLLLLRRQGKSLWAAGGVQQAS